MKNKKKQYLSPKVNKIKVDKDISIQMASPTNPPGDPFINKSKDSGDLNPFK